MLHLGAFSCCFDRQRKAGHCGVCHACVTESGTRESVEKGGGMAGFGGTQGVQMAWHAWQVKQQGKQGSRRKTRSSG